MATWTSDELKKIGTADELQLASSRHDGTLRSPVTIWVVRYGNDIYVRPVKGRDGWHRGTQTRHEGHIQSGGVEKDVTFADVDHSLDDHIDAEYRTKYRRYDARYVNPVLTPESRDATLKLVPR